MRIEPFSVSARKIGADSQFPNLQVSHDGEPLTKLDEDDELFIGYEMFQDFLPYARQDSYDDPEEPLKFQSVVLENEFLKAVFLPELGGRLWSLYDKEHHRDLILANTRLLPCRSRLCKRGSQDAGRVGRI